MLKPTTASDVIPPVHDDPVDLDPLTEAIIALARHDATCAQCDASLPESECGERTRLKAGWRRAVREGAQMIAAGGPGHASPDYGSAGGQTTAEEPAR